MPIYWYITRECKLTDTVVNESTLDLPVPLVGVIDIVVANSEGLTSPVLGFKGIELSPGTLSSKEGKNKYKHYNQNDHYN